MHSIANASRALPVRFITLKRRFLRMDRPPSIANFLSRARALIGRGFSIIPIAPRAKYPAGPGATARTRDITKVKEWSAQWPDANVAICADEDITILESDDCARFRATLTKMGVCLPETLTGGASENRPHFFYKRTPRCD